MTAQTVFVLAEPIDRPPNLVAHVLQALLSFGQWGLSDGSHYFGHRQPVIPLRVGLAYSEDPGCHRTVIPGAALASFRYGILSIRQHGWRLVDGEGLDGVPVGNNLAHRMAPCVRGVRDLP
jgi:hypothetical protein